MSSGRSLRIVDAKVWYEGQLYEAGILVEDGVVKAISKEANLPQVDDVLSARGGLLLPAFVDIHSHLRDAELSYKERFETGTAAALAGGFGLVLNMPNTKPPTTTASRLKDMIESAKGRILCDVGFYATPRGLNEIDALTEGGCVAFKAYMHRSLDGEDYSSEEALVSILERVKGSGLLLSIHAEDPRELRAIQGETDSEEHSRAHPPEAELEGVRMVIGAAGKTSGRVHLAHISLRKSLEMVQEARQKGMDVSWEATPHHALLTAGSFERLGKMAVVEPPLRSRDDQEAILRGIESGAIDMIASDHAPHQLDEKLSSAPPPGFPGLETASLLFLHRVAQGLLDLRTFVNMISARPASRFGLKGYGAIRAGAPANLVIVDLKEARRIDAKRFLSRARYSPFDGERVQAAILATILRGEIVYHDGEVMARPGGGRIVYGKGLHS